jgi:hypothetical protein
MIGVYNNERFNAFQKENKIKLSKRGEINNFLIKKVSNEIFSYITVNKEELQELYKINFYVKWQNMKFECGCNVWKKVIYLRYYDNYTIAKKYNFVEYDRGCFYKEVSIDECSDFMYEKIDYLNNAQTNRYEIVKEEFLDIYKKNVDELK